MRRSLPETVQIELRRAVHSPYETPIVVAGNGILLTALWLLFPSNLLFTFHGELAFPMVLASWMYSDVPATNVLGTDVGSSLRALGDVRTLRQLLHARTLVLWIFVAPICVLIALILGFNDGRPLATLFTVIWVAVVPFGALPLAGWLGIFYPYHPMPLKRRWELRSRWKPMFVRWLSLAVIPYGLVGLLILVVSAPSLIYWINVWPDWRIERIPPGPFAWGVVIACATSPLAWWLGSEWGARIAYRRRDRLTAFLSDPDAG
jgi:hypothetical protein